jgi:hypothetical protein
MKNKFILILISLIIIKCQEEDEEEGEKIYKYVPIYEYNCEYGVTVINEKNCTSVNTSYSITQNLHKCCYISYKNESTGEVIEKCKIVEDTEYGIKLYKHVLASYDEVKIICLGNYYKINNFFILLILLFSLIL